jgi:hypothetical protein
MSDQLNLLFSDLLAQKFPQEKILISNIESLSSDLLVHEFKYENTKDQLRGVHPFKIKYTINNKPHEIEALLKIKPSETEIFKIYRHLLSLCQIYPKFNLDEMLRLSDFKAPNIKEALLFRDFFDALSNYLPESYGVTINEQQGSAARLEAFISEGSFIATPNDDSTDLWKNEFFKVALEGLAGMHACFYENYGQLLKTGYFPLINTSVKTMGIELWKSLFVFLREHYTKLVSEKEFLAHEYYINTLTHWYPLFDQQPKTLVYGDVNPQNLAFEKQGETYRLFLFDWERATIQPVQIDLAEYLVYTLDENFSEAKLWQLIDDYIQILSKHLKQDINKQFFIEGLIYALQDLIINRLPLMIAVAHCFQKRRLAPKAYQIAHRILSLLK